MRRWILLSFVALCGWAVAHNRSANAQAEGWRGPGRYRIEVVASGKVLDLRMDDKRTVQQWSSSGANNQQWEVEDGGTGFYYLRSVENGKVIDFAENRTRDGVGIIVADKRASDYQLWKIAEAGNGQYTIISKAGKALEVPANLRTQDGAKLQTMGPHGLENQRFRFFRLGDLPIVSGRPRERDVGSRPIATPTPTPVDSAQYTGPGRYTIQIVSSGKALDLDGRDGESLIQHPLHGARNQQWDIEDAGGGYVYIRSAENGKALEVADRRVKDGSAVLGRTPNKSDQQKWRIVAKGNGEFTIVSRLGKALDLPNSSPEDNLKMYVWQEHGAPNQRFRFKRVAAQVETYARVPVRGAQPTPTPTPVAAYTPGSLRWRGRVDTEILLDVRGNTVTERNVTGRSYNNGRYTFTTSLPGRELNLRIRNIKARGSVEIVEQPTLSNGWTAVIRIRDPEGDAADYEFELSW